MLSENELRKNKFFNKFKFMKVTEKMKSEDEINFACELWHLINKIDTMIWTHYKDGNKFVCKFWHLINDINNMVWDCYEDERMCLASR